jgi:DNA polymerase III epsilon subunit-like protein
MNNSGADEWMASVVARLGGLPKNYMVFDVESTGLDLSNDLVIQLGYALVMDKVLVECSSIMVDWTHSRDDEFCQWLDNRMTSTRNNMEAKNPGAGMYKHSVARLKEKGIPAYDAFTHFMDIVKLCRLNKFSFIAHNGLRFDQPMLDRCVKQLRGEDESFKLDTVSGMYFDTMGLERGSQTKIMPTPSDDWYTFNHRLVYEGGRIFSSLDRHCSNKYNLVNKHSLEGSAHEADFDCRLTHHLFEEFREMAERGAAA